MKSEPAQRAVERVEAIAETLRQGALQETEALVKFELDVEQLATQEAGLLNAYLSDDADAAKHYWQGLKRELQAWTEVHAEQWLESAANPASVHGVRLNFRLRGDLEHLLQGEIAVEQDLSCMNCGRTVQVDEPVIVSGCHDCGCEIFTAKPRKTPDH